VDIYARTTRNPRYAKFSHRLAKITQTTQKKRATDNAMATHNVAWLQCAPRRHFFVKSLLHLCKFLVNPKFDQETNYIFRKPMDSCFQPCIVCAEILWTFHTWIEYMHTLKNAIQTSGGKKLPKPSLPLRGCGPHLIHPSVERPMHSPPQTASRSNQPFCQIHPRIWRNWTHVQVWFRRQVSFYVAGPHVSNSRSATDEHRLWKF